MDQIISLCNQKGGVGKTTTAVNLSAALALAGLRVLVVDLDPQGNATSGLGAPKETDKTIYPVLMGALAASEAIVTTDIPNLQLIPSNRDLTGATVELLQHTHREQALHGVLRTLRGDYDLILVDCPPSLGILTVNALVASDTVLIPIQCEYYALEGLAELISTLDIIRQSLNPELSIQGVLLTMHDERLNLSSQITESVRQHFGSKVYKTIIPRNVRLAESPSFGKPVLAYDPKSTGANSYNQLAGEVLAQLTAHPKAKVTQMEVLG